MQPSTDMVDVVTVRVLLFSVLREQIGSRELDVSLPRGSSSTANLIAVLEEQHPSIRSYAGVLRVAVNEEYVDGPVDLADGDEVALITPVSGG